MDLAWKCHQILLFILFKYKHLGFCRHGKINNLSIDSLTWPYFLWYFPALIMISHLHLGRTGGSRQTHRKTLFFFTRLQDPDTFRLYICLLLFVFNPTPVEIIENSFNHFVLLHFSPSAFFAVWKLNSVFHFKLSDFLHSKPQRKRWCGVAEKRDGIALSQSEGHVSYLDSMLLSLSHSSKRSWDPEDKNLQSILPDQYVLFFKKNVSAVLEIFVSTYAYTFFFLSLLISSWVSSSMRRVPSVMSVILWLLTRRQR